MKARACVPPLVTQVTRSSLSARPGRPLTLSTIKRATEPLATTVTGAYREVPIQRLSNS